MGWQKTVGDNPYPESMGCQKFMGDNPCPECRGCQSFMGDNPWRIGFKQHQLLVSENRG
jgi:hypothetical protein